MSLAMTATRASNRLMPCSCRNVDQFPEPTRFKSVDTTHLELRPGVGVEGAVVVEDVDELEVVALARLVVRGVVCEIGRAHV